MPASPTGARITGNSRRSPSTVVPIDRFETSRITRCRSEIASRSAVLAARVASS
jgi:hypothetical protein